jgi:uncharacterized repeat protein (TIGR02543 family)
MSRGAGVVCLFALLAALGLGGGAAPAAAAGSPTLKIEVIGAGRVTGLGINCGTGALACYAAYGTSPTAVTLKAAAAAGWTFSHWEDDASTCGTTATPCPVTVSNDMTATAVFTTTKVVTTSTYGVSLASPANGTVTNDGTAALTTNPVDCPTTPADCGFSVVQGSTVTVVETPATGYLFGGWGGSCSGSAVSCAVYVNAATKSVSATFLDATALNQLEVVASGNGTVTGGGITCAAGSTCDVQEPPNATVTLVAKPLSGYAFVGWDGDCSGTGPSCTVQMSLSRSVTATFEQIVPLALTVDGTGTVSGGGITCAGPQTCQGSLTPGATVTLTASGDDVNWFGCTSAAGNLCSVTVGTTAVAIIATFGGSTSSSGTYSLNVDVNGDGYVISTAGTTLHCTAAGGTGCSVNVEANTTVTLSALPASGSATDFTHWLGDCAGFTTTTCTLTMNGAKTVEADFAGGNTTYVLSAQVNGSGTVTGAGISCTIASSVGCAVQQAAGATVTVTATPSAGASFTGWTSGCTGTSPTCTVQMVAARAVAASFTGSGSSGGGGVATGESLVVTVTGAGTVTAPAGSCVGVSGKTRSCTQNYSAGESVALSEKPKPGYAFAGWTGACSGGKATCTATVSGSTAVGARFVRIELAPGRAPRVAAISGGYSVTLFFAVHQKGTVTAAVTRSGKALPGTSASVRAGNRRLTLTVPGKGSYVFTVTLASASGSHAIRWRLSVH